MLNTPIRRRKRTLAAERLFILLVLTVILLILLLSFFLFLWKGKDDSTYSPNSGQPAAAILPESAQQAEGTASSAPNHTEYYTVTRTEEDLHRGDLILVNAKDELPCRFLEDEYLVSIFDGKSSSYNVYDMNVQLSSRALAPLNRMMDDFYAEYGTDSVNVVSGYRSYETQEALLSEEIAEKGATEAERWVTKPGYSEHHTGLAIDLSIYHTEEGTSEEYDGTGIYAWINENAYKYGYVVRYEDKKREFTGIYHEPWHFRYVGIPHAFVMKENELCLEEYIQYLKAYRYEDQHLNVTCDGVGYEIYYTEDMEVPVPADREYSISGNNADGFIVTVRES